MRVTHLRSVDLNLLVVLAALLDECHVTRAAERVRLSQSATSRALQRLRDTFGDELLVRTRNGYEPTARATRLHRELTLLLPRLETLFRGETFDPATATDEFRLAGTDYAAMVIGPDLVRRVFAEGPDLRLELRTWHDTVFDDVDRGRLHLAFSDAPVPGSLCAEELFEDRFVCMVSADHPVRGERVSLADYLAHKHLVVNVRGGRQTRIDHFLHELGTHRETALLVPFHAAATQAIHGTALIATLPRRIACRHADDPGLRLLEAPAEFDTMRYLMAWHPRLDEDPAHRWLRDTIRLVTAGLQASESI